MKFCSFRKVHQEPGKIIYIEFYSEHGRGGVIIGGS